jgi:hypothetical protein
LPLLQADRQTLAGADVCLLLSVGKGIALRQLEEEVHNRSVWLQYVSELAEVRQLVELHADGRGWQTRLS